MKNKIMGAFIFGIGAAIGSIVTWKLLDTKYEQRTQEEIDSVKEAFSKRAKSKKEDAEPCVERENDTATPNKTDMRNYHDILVNNGYVVSSYGDEKKEDVEKPYVIPPEEFGELDEYEMISLNYYEDGVLTDDRDELIEDVEEIVGFESLSHFGEYEDDSVFVRNDRLKADYEILRDERTYVEVMKERPHRTEVL